jgi:hypothetical protein
LRILAVGVLAGGLGAAGQRWRRWYPTFAILFVILFPALRHDRDNFSSPARSARR